LDEVSIDTFASLGPMIACGEKLLACLKRRTGGAFSRSDQYKVRSFDQARVYRGVSRAELSSSQMNWLTRGPESARHPHQVGKGVRFHLLHNLPAVRLHRDLADAELTANLFIQQPGDD
jgi:hypothetical protein